MKPESYYKNNIYTIENFPKKGIMFRDITLTLQNPEAFQNCINDLAELASKYDYDKIMCADARGFLFGSPLAYKTGKGLVISRKEGKLPRPGTKYSYTLEYGKNTMVIPQDSLKEGDRVLIMDDLLATGGSSIAMIEMAKIEGAIPVAAIFYVELPDLHGAENIRKAIDIPVESLVKFEGE